MTFEEARVQIGKNIARERSKCGLTTRNITEMSGIDDSSVTKIELGKGNPSIKTLSRIANAMGCDLSLFFSLENKK